MIAWSVIIAHALLLSAGELARQGIQAILQPGQFQRRNGMRAPLGLQYRLGRQPAPHSA
jgi:hypothetical protein